MHQEPIPVAFVVSAAAGAILAPPIHGADLGVIVAGATLTAATTGIVAAGMQFLPSRWFNALTGVAAVATWALVSTILAAWGSIWLGAVPPRLGIAWAVGSASAL